MLIIRLQEPVPSDVSPSLTLELHFLEICHCHLYYNGVLQSQGSPRSGEEYSDEEGGGAREMSVMEVSAEATLKTCRENGGLGETWAIGPPHFPSLGSHKKKWGEF